MRGLKQRSARKAACWLASSCSLNYLSYTDQGHLPRNGTVPPTPTTAISTQENVPTEDVPTTALSAGGSSSRGVSSFQVTLACVTLTKN